MRKIQISPDCGPNDEPEFTFDFYESDDSRFISDMEGWSTELERTNVYEALMQRVDERVEEVSDGSDG